MSLGTDNKRPPLGLDERTGALRASTMLTSQTYVFLDFYLALMRPISRGRCVRCVFFFFSFQTVPIVFDNDDGDGHRPEPASRTPCVFI